MQDFEPRAIANTNRCGSGDAYRSLDSTSGEMALLFAADRREPAGAGGAAGERRGTDRSGRRGEEPAPRDAAGTHGVGIHAPILPGQMVATRSSGRVPVRRRPVDVVDRDPGASLLDVLRERLGIASVKDGCAPQGQCGCCTVLVDGEPRVACVTPVAAGRRTRRSPRSTGSTRRCATRLVDAFVATGGSQCGFCTPGIIVRAAALATARGRRRHRDVDRALAAHLCRCTGWQTIYEAIDAAAATPRQSRRATSMRRGRRRAALEGGGRAARRPRGAARGAAASPTTPRRRDALVAVPLPPRSEARGRRPGCGGSSASRSPRPASSPGRSRAGARRSTSAPPLALPAASRRWRAPRDELGRARVPRARRVVVRARRRARDAARERRRVRRQVGVARAVAARVSSPTSTAGPCGSSTRARTCVRLGPKRPPIAASAVLARRPSARSTGRSWAAVVRRRGADVRLRPRHRRTRVVDAAGARTADVVARRAVGLSPSRRVLVEGALDAAGVDRAEVVRATHGAACSSTRACEPASGAARCAGRVDAANGAIDRGRGPSRGGRPARRGRAALLLHRRRAHGARLGVQRRPRRRSRHRRRARPHDPLLRRDPPARTCRRSRSRSSTTHVPPPATRVRRGVRRGRCRDLERDHRVRGHPPRGLARHGGTGHREASLRR